jgi:hypothetical protein
MGVVTAYVGVSLFLGGTTAAKPAFIGVTLAWILILMAGIMRSMTGPTCAQVSEKTSSSGHRTSWLELVAFNVILTLVLAEVGFRAFALFAGSSVIISDSLDAHLLVPGHDYGDGLRGNRLGFPGADFRVEKRAGTIRIAALGDSFALGPAVPFADNYLTLLESRAAGTEVYNFGVTGAGPREYRAVLQRFVWTYRPDMVLLSVFVGNDITEALATPRHMDPRQLSLYLLVSRGWRLAREQVRRPAESAPKDPQRRVSAALSPETFREVEARRMAVCLKASPRGMEKKWRRALEDLDAIVRACRQRGVRLGVVLIPDELQVNPEVRDEALKEAGARSEEVDLELPQRRLVAFFEKREVACLDLLPLLKKHPHSYAVRDTHWNAEGNRLAAEAIAAWLSK